MIKLRSVKAFCCEDYCLIENYEKAINDKINHWDCHHRLETEQNLSVKELKEMNKYYKVPASELIFLTHSEHAKIHQSGKKRGTTWNKGKQLSEETKNKLSESHKGLKYPNRKKVQQTEESKIKRSLSLKGNTNGFKKGHIPWNKGLKKGSSLAP